MNQQVMIQALLNQLKAQNPTAYNQVISMMNSGVNPNEYISRLKNTGAITDADVNTAQNYLNNLNQKNNRKTF